MRRELMRREIKKVVTLGEIMLRLSPPQHQRFAQAASFDVNYGGSEANVAASLAQFGHHAVFLTRVPDNAIGRCAVASLARYGVDCSRVAYGGSRLGLYYLENGASVRPSDVVYDREGSAFAEAVPEDFDLDAILADADLFHISGITVSVSARGAALALAAARCAKAHGAMVSFDLNYRGRLWQTDVAAKREAMAALMPSVDICFGNPLDAQRCLGYHADVDFGVCEYDVCISEPQMRAMSKAYGLKFLVASRRESHSASDNGWSAVVCGDGGLYRSSAYQLHIVDRVGGGDAFAAGFLHGVLEGWDQERALEFAVAAAAIKHTIPGDVNIATAAEVEALMREGGSGRVRR